MEAGGKCYYCCVCDNLMITLRAAPPANFCSVCGYADIQEVPDAENAVNDGADEIEVEQTTPNLDEEDPEEFNSMDYIWNPVTAEELQILDSVEGNDEEFDSITDYVDERGFFNLDIPDQPTNQTMPSERRMFEYLMETLRASHRRSSTTSPHLQNTHQYYRRSSSAIDPVRDTSRDNGRSNVIDLTGDEEREDQLPADELLFERNLDLNYRIEEELDEIFVNVSRAVLRDLGYDSNESWSPPFRSGSFQSLHTDTNSTRHTTAIKKRLLATDRDANELCSICHDTIGTESDACYLTCSHLYHLCCITTWCRINPVCPCCRTEVRLPR